MGAANRVDFVDYAKGFCILLIVMMHSTLGVESAVGQEGWLHSVVEFAAPFRVPDFFLLSGLFVARTIDRNWRHYLDKKFVHYAYFYVLWLVINFAFKAPSMASEIGWSGVAETFLISFIDPFGSLWFIYMLPIFLVVTKLTRSLPGWSVWLVAAILQILPISTGWMVIDEFASRFVYFYTGYLLAPWIFRLADLAIKRAGIALVAVGVWAVGNWGLVQLDVAELPVVSLALGFAGCAAIVTVSALMSKTDLMAPIRYCGANSIVIYLAFFLPMATTREALISFGIISDVGTMSLIVWAVASISPLILFWIVRNTPFRFLFERPRWAYTYNRPSRLAPAE